VLERRSGARREAISAALQPQIPLSSRALLLLSVLRPEAAARMLARQFEDGGRRRSSCWRSMSYYSGR
jgi:hypothetical protein